ncbi:MAG: hypothetical protein KAS32_12060 [Candidatus Peribacteraceae bacterium]|nr:hypothetical protein [Candidatus Peribacteraceae bacterium]
MSRRYLIKDEVGNKTCPYCFSVNEFKDGTIYGGVYSTVCTKCHRVSWNESRVLTQKQLIKFKREIGWID